MQVASSWLRAVEILARGDVANAAFLSGRMPVLQALGARPRRARGTQRGVLWFNIVRS
jgi:hypothetical protein